MRENNRELEAAVIRGDRALAEARSATAAMAAQRRAAEARVAALEQEVAALEAEVLEAAAIQPLAASEGARQLDALLDVDAATRERLAALAAELAELRALTEAQRAALVERDEAATGRVDAISAQLASSLAVSPAEARAAATAVVRRESQIAGQVLARVGGADDVALVSGRNVAYTAGLSFAPAEADLSPEGEAELSQIASELKRLTETLPDDLPWMLRVDGHTDDLPIRSGRFRSNWELSAARASTVAQFLVNAGIPADRLIAAGFADTQPVATERTVAARAQNRRIEMRLTVR